MDFRFTQDMWLSWMGWEGFVGGEVGIGVVNLGSLGLLDSQMYTMHLSLRGVHSSLRLVKIGDLEFPE